METQLTNLAIKLSQRCLLAKQSVSVAESCTGGWVAKVITDLAGSSLWFDRGFVTYSNQAKQDMLGVQLNTLETYGAVSEAVVREMATGALARSSADAAVAISGIAGPGGGTADKPVGTVWFAWASSESPIVTLCVRFAGDRNQVRQLAVEKALEGLVSCFE